ncbi:NAD-dependent epimerase/dehydratase family protein [Donghicola mangrovi]|uniref:NAD(P)-dependent oxidoreductase n=1 Tax=Donghicola mangrovi TaxID=2729614 RepID=A0A850Q4D6_9RHOB|nr:NAD(P)-dependent oxidoreductase [Donghicola mangrovi]NVO22912.1 NAD(P)-dependent oxidoreductase [Donghicola mangrovi]
MKIAVTGASGYLGHFVMNGLRHAGHDVLALSRQPFANHHHVEYELGDAPEICGMDAVVHCAFSHVPGKYRGGEGDDPEGFRLLNVDGSITLFKAAKAQGVRRLIFLSSRAVYGPKPAGTVLTEDTPCTPDTLYGEAKLEAEEALLAMADVGFQPTALRATGVYGAAYPQGWHKWRGLFEEFENGHPIEPRQGTEVHGHDMTAAINLLLTAPKAPRIANLSDILVDRHDVLREYADFAGLTLPLPARVDETFNVMDCTALRSIGWQPGGRKRLTEFLSGLRKSAPQGA